MPGTQPEALLHVSMPVHALVSSQTSGLLWQVPLPQISPTVQASLSLHGAVLFVNTHPLPGLHPSFVQMFPSVHTSDVPGWHAPFWHVSFTVQALPSVQPLPFETGGLEQMPDVVLQTPTA